MILGILTKITEYTSFIMIIGFLMSLIASIETREGDHCFASSLPVLVSAGIELISFLVAGTVCFGFSVRIMLITP